MAGLLSPTLYTLQWQRKPTTLSSLLISKHPQRLHTARRTSTAHLTFEPDQRPEPHHVAASNWSFEQRMEEALDVLEIMESRRMTPDPNVFCTLIKSCTDERNIEFGKTIHSKIIGTKFERDVFVVNNLINMYAKCGCLESARALFDKMPHRNAVSWTSVISMYSQMGFPGKALELYSLMKSGSEIRPNVFTYTIVLNSCAKMKNLEMGIEVHEDMVKDGCESDDFVVTALIDMYSKCGKVDRARQVFDKVKEPSVAACTAMIDGYNDNDRAEEAIGIIRKVLGSRLDMNVVRELGFTCMIRSCILRAALRQGQEIHAHMIKFGYEVELGGVQAMTHFILLYAKCNKMALASRLFSKSRAKSESLYGKMMAGYVRNKMNREALELYVEMVNDSVELNSFVLSWALKSCLAMGIAGLKQGKEIQGRAIKAGYGPFIARLFCLAALNIA